MSDNENSPPEEMPNVDPRSVTAPWWYFPALLLLVLVVGLTFAGLRGQFAPAGSSPGSATQWQPSEAPQGKTVSLTIDFGNGTRRVFGKLPWQAETTVAHLMESAREFRPGIRYEQQGEGEGAFLSSLEGVANGGADQPGEKQRNWLYRVNGEHAHVSYAVYPLEPGDRVTWIYDYGEGE